MSLLMDLVSKDTYNDIIKFYGSDFEGDKLQLHRDMFLGVAKSKKVIIKNIDDVLKLMKNDYILRQMLSYL